MSATVFWICIALVLYTYALYPLLVRLLARGRGCTPRVGTALPPLTVVIAAHDEAARIEARVHDVLAQDYPAENLHVIVVDDGSQDGTAEAAAIDDPRVRVLKLEHNQGKAVALNAAVAEIEGGLVAFTDARQRFAPGALRKLAGPFTDPAVGAVSGELAIAAPEDAAGSDVGLYWRMEVALRQGEARLRWLHGVSGAIHAMRRELVPELPPGLILDDMYLPLSVVFSGGWVWMTREAIAVDTSSASTTAEFRRKLRTLAGNWQLMARLPRLLNPAGNPVFFAWVSHKLLRLLAPWALIASVIASATAAGAFYVTMLWLQLAAYAGATAAILWPRATARIPLLKTAGTFVMLNVAALLSLPACIALDPRGLWKKH
jgi:cellulose synthase/poly-beta-1,6-N-acetylglucosamine synthase-like glycosyltransferase